MVETFMIKTSSISKKTILLIACMPFLLIALVSCDIESDSDRAEIDRNKILDYLQENQIEGYYELESGVFVYIDKPGSGEQRPHEQSRVQMIHTGYFLDGEFFHNTGVPENVNLSSVVRGLKYGVMEFRRGGTGTIFVPSALGFGRQTIGDIPKNSVLIFDVEIIDF